MTAERSGQGLRLKRRNGQASRACPFRSFEETTAGEEGSWKVLISKEVFHASLLLLSIFTELQAIQFQKLMLSSV